LLLSSFLTVLGLIVLRIREPKLERPYKVWAYPVVPIFFLAITLWMMFYVILDQPTESLLGLITVIGGLIIYFFAREPGRKAIRHP
jgi:basic amino acid/polyamine antiporter, APA family